MPRGFQDHRHARCVVVCARIDFATPHTKMVIMRADNNKLVTQLRIAESFDRIAAGRTVLTIAHQRVLVDLADRVVGIDHGRIVAPTAGELR